MSVTSNGTSRAGSEVQIASAVPVNGVHDSKKATGTSQETQVRSFSINQDIPRILPHEKVFSIQIGSDCFKLSGASISSDAPSYFSQYFLCKLTEASDRGEDPNHATKTLYIDRDPVTFNDVALHLRGYSVQPRNAEHFVRLFADAQFYHLPRLISQLFETDIFVTINGTEFRIPRDTFSAPGNTPNYFSLGFAAFFANPGEVFPGLNFEGLIRPPSIVPPSIPNRSASTFAEVLHLLRGYPLRIRSAEHRQELLRDCRYYHLKGLEQKLIHCSRSYNLARGKDELILRLCDVRQSGISIPVEPSSESSLYGFVHYARPFVDEKAYELILEVGNDCARLHHTSVASAMRVEFFGDAKARITRLLEVVATKLNLPSNTQPLGLLMKTGGAAGVEGPHPGNTPLSAELVKCWIGEDASVVVDGNEWHPPLQSARGADSDRGPESSPKTWSIHLSNQEQGQSAAKKRKMDQHSPFESQSLPSPSPSATWLVKSGQWRLRIQHRGGVTNGMECVLIAVKLDAFSGELSRNARSRFLEDD